MCETQTSENPCYANLGAPTRVWAISAIHGELDKITRLHDALLTRFMPGDRIVYLGNYTGYNDQAAATIDEILAFRRMILSVPGVLPEDFVYLRGRQEEMLDKLLQIQFAPDPRDVLDWMLDNGLQPTLASYGISVEEGRACTREGIMATTRWTSRVRQRIKAHAGHDTFLTHLRRAAFTDVVPENAPLLFVNAGIDARRPLHQQGDSLWWNTQSFNRLEHAYAPFRRIIRGYDPDRQGVHINGVSATLDGGCGFGGELVCAGWSCRGEAFDVIRV